MDSHHPKGITNMWKKGLTAYCFKLFAIFAIVLILIVSIFCYIELRNSYKQYTFQVNATLKTEQDIFDDAINRAIAHSNYLKKEILKELFDFHYVNIASRNKNALKLRKNVDQALALFSKYHNEYDQIRYIDQNGQEIVRINHRDGKVEIVPEDKLQNKKHRYYFKNAFFTNENTLYFSPLDLNVEHKKIEWPLKPMIRIGTPIILKGGKKIGVLILNYNAKPLLNTLQSAMRSVSGYWYAANLDGHLFLSDNPQQEWGNMFASRKHITFSSLYPSVSKKLRKSNGKVIYSPYGAFLEKDLTLSLPELKGSDLTFKIIWVAPWSLIIPDTIKYYLLFAFFVLIGLFYLSWHLALSKKEHAEYEDKLRYFSRHDPLTKLYNRRELFNIGELELKRADRSDLAFSVLMVDIDFFKKINDRYGHGYGDKALTTLAKILKDSIRETDIAARYGGEEFIIILSQTNLDAAKIFAEKLRRKISEVKIPIHDTSFSFTVSIGVSMWTKNDRSLDAIIERSDKNLYAAKNNGRNCVVAYY